MGRLASRGLAGVLSGRVPVAIAGGKFLLAPGQQNAAATFLASNVWAPRIEGATPYASRVDWTGGALPMFLLRDVTNGRLARLYLVSNNAHVCAAAVQMENGGTGGVPTRNTVEDVEIEGTNGGFSYGVRWVLGAGGDSNNDLSILTNVRVRNVVEAAFRIDHSQSVQHTFRSCFGSAGKYILYLANGQFRWLDGGGGNSSVADFYIAAISGGVPTVISGHDSEGSKRFIETAGPFGECNIEIANSRFADNALNADGYAVKLRGAGPFVLTNNTWRTGRLWISADGFFPIAITLRGNAYLVGPAAGPWTSPYYFGTVHKNSRITVEGEHYVDSDGLPIDLSTFPAGATTPQVFAGHLFYTGNAAPTTISNFLDGWHSHSFQLVATDANTTVAHNATIKLIGGVNLLLTSGRVYSFVNDQGVWRQVS